MENVKKRNFFVKKRRGKDGKKTEKRRKRDGKRRKKGRKNRQDPSKQISEQSPEN